MRMTPEERQELDAWVEKEYPKSMERIDALNPYHQIGKKKECQPKHNNKISSLIG